MKSIELTEDHKSKLLEMCKKLFPNEEFNFGNFYSSECGGEYYGLDYLDVTHINHKIPYKEYSSSEPNGIVNNTKQGCFEMDHDTNTLKQGGSYCEVYVEGIHWFEFCITHLPVALYRYTMHKYNIKPTNVFSNIIEGNLNQLQDFDRYYINPVDYLYEEFQKLE